MHYISNKIKMAQFYHSSIIAKRGKWLVLVRHHLSKGQSDNVGTQISFSSWRYPLKTILRYLNSLYLFISQIAYIIFSKHLNFCLTSYWCFISIILLNSHNNTDKEPRLQEDLPFAQNAQRVSYRIRNPTSHFQNLHVWSLHMP